MKTVRSILKTIYVGMAFIGIQAVAGIQAEFYVDATLGNDANPGTEAAPFKTIEQGLDAARSENNWSMTGDIIVYLRGGTYPVDEPIVLSSHDSGNNGYRMILRNYPNEAPILEGGVPITGWTPAGGGIYQANVGSFEFIQLYVNNKLAQRARFPERGSEHRIIANKKTAQKIELNSAHISNWSNLNRVQLVQARSFTLARVRIASFTTSGGVATVIPMEPERSNLFDDVDGPLDGKPSFYFENHLDFLDTPGEWFLDVDTDTVYYMPRPGEDLSVMEVIAPKTEQLFRINYAHDITVFGLTFQHSAWNLPQTDGMVQRQAGMHITEEYPFTVLPAAVYFKHMYDVRIERCIFRQLGANGINFDIGTHNNLLIGNVFSEIADTGIDYDIDNIRSLTQNPLNISRDDTFDSNYFFHMGTIYYGGGALFAFWPKSISIVHNEISYTGGLGINVGWGADSALSIMHAPDVSFNRIHDVAVWCRDSGGIHTKSNADGGTIFNNWIYNADTVDDWFTGPDRTVNGMHLDDNTGNYEISRNVFMNTETTNIRDKPSNFNITGGSNGGQSQATKDASGLRVGYRDIKHFHNGGAIGRDLEPGELYLGSESLPSLFDDDFDDLDTGIKPPGYQANDGQGGGSISIVNVPGGGNKSVRIVCRTGGGAAPNLNKTFTPQAGRLAFEFKIKASSTTRNLWCELFDINNNTACKVGLNDAGGFSYHHWDNKEVEIPVVTYTAGTWYTFRLEVDVTKQQYSLWINGDIMLAECLFDEPIESLQKFRLRPPDIGGFFDIDYIQSEGEVVDGVISSNGTTYAWMDSHYNISGWNAADFALFDQADSDGDAQETWKEYQADTDPNNSASLFKIAGTTNSASGLQISWGSMEERYYTVQTTPALSSTWSNVMGYVNIPGTGTNMTYSDSAQPSDTNRFFRINVSATE